MLQGKFLEAVHSFDRSAEETATATRKQASKLLKTTLESLIGYQQTGKKGVEKHKLSWRSYEVNLERNRAEFPRRTKGAERRLEDG
ncbi:MAG: hypothetical protein AABO41_12485 [Acidobacteriota bacterium]